MGLEGYLWWNDAIHGDPGYRFGSDHCLPTDRIVVA